MQKATEAALARLLQCSRQAIHKHVQSGLLAKDADGLIDVAAAKAALAAALHPDAKLTRNVQAALAPPPPQPPSSPQAATVSAAADVTATSYHVARTLREAAEAGIAKLKLGELSGALLRRETTERAVFDAFRALRDQVFACPPRLAPRLADITEVRQLEALIADELRRAFEHWEERMRERLASPPPAPAEAEAEAAP